MSRGRKPSIRLKIDGETLERMYVRDLWPSNRIADHFGCSKPTVLARLRELGIKIRHHNDTKRGVTNHMRIYLDTDKVVSMYLSHPNMSQARVAKKFGVSTAIITRELKSAGVKIRTLSEVITGTRWGKNNANWNPKLTAKERALKRPSGISSAWRNSVYERDKFTCQCCGDNRGGNLNAHHIRNHATNKKLRWEISNGITLCDACHRGFHKELGYRNNDELQLAAYISSRKKIAA